MNAQMICFFILGLGPVVTLAVSLFVDIVKKNKEHKSHSQTKQVATILGRPPTPTLKVKNGAEPNFGPSPILDAAHTKTLKVGS